MQVVALRLPVRLVPPAARALHVVAVGWTGGGRASGRDRGPPPPRRGGGGRGRGRPPPQQQRRTPPPPVDPFDAMDLTTESTGRRQVGYFATCHPGLEAVVARELARPTVAARSVTPGVGGVYFSGDAATGYRACLWLRCAIRVLRLESRGALAGGARGGDRLYAFVRRAADWSSLVPPGATIAVDARVGATDDLTPQTALIVTRDAVCDAVRDVTGARPPPPAAAGGRVDVPIFVAVHRGRAWIYRDMAGASLHKRGYRRGAPVHRAALNESAAAGVLEMSGWAGAAASGAALPVLADPMCGSGTLLIEAALMARRVAPGLARSDAHWPFVAWPDADSQAWRQAREAAESAARPDITPVLLGNDVHSGALSLAESGAAAAGVSDCITLRRGDVRGWRPSPRPTLVVTNPPWGKRLEYEDGGGGSENDDPWAALGQFLRVSASPGDAYVVCGDPAASRGVRMKATGKLPLALGGENVRVLHYGVLPPRRGGGDGDEA